MTANQKSTTTPDRGKQREQRVAGEEDAAGGQREAVHVVAHVVVVEDVDDLAEQRQLPAAEEPGLVGAEVEAAVGVRPQRVPLLGQDHRRRHLAAVEPGQGKAAAVTVLGAEVQGLAQAVARVERERVALVEVGVELQAVRLVAAARLAVAVGDPAREAVGAAPLEEDLDPRASGR